MEFQEDFIAQSEDLVGKDVKFKVKITSLRYPKPYNIDDFGFTIGTFQILEVLEGKISEEVFYLGERGDIVFKGNVIRLQLLGEYILEGRFIIDPKYGPQYECYGIYSQFSIDTPEQARTFLETILTPSQVEKLYDFSENPISLLEENDLEKLVKVPGIGPITGQKLLDRYKKNKVIGSAYIDLLKMGLTTTAIASLIQTYGDPHKALSRVNKNPYCLIKDVKGFGWEKADALALSMGFKKDSLERVEAFCYYYFDKIAEDEGHSWVDINVFLSLIQEKCGIEDDAKVVRYAKILLGEIEEPGYEQFHQNPVLFFDNKYSRIGGMKLRKIEDNIAKNLHRLAKTKPYKEIHPEVAKKIIEQAEEKLGFVYTDEQKTAIWNCLNNQVSILTGLPGTGKTYSMKAIVDVLQAHGYIIKQVALSGRAASKLSEVTHLEGETIHRALQWNPQTYRFMRNEDNPLSVDAIIVDEVSMVGGELFEKLVKAIPGGAKLILVGDTQQLEAIGSCNILKDCISSKVIPTVQLAKIHRQAEKSGIITNSIKACNSEQIFSSSFIGEEVRGELQDFKLIVYDDAALTYPKIIEEYQNLLAKGVSYKDIQIIVPMKERGMASCLRLNMAIQKIVNPARVGEEIIRYTKKIGGEEVTLEFRQNDTIIITHNDYTTIDITGKNCPVYNGNIGRIVSIQDKAVIVELSEQGQVVLTNPKDIMQLGYAITVHKKQGDSSPYVIFGLDSYSYALYSKELVYTAITRARKYCAVVTQNSAYRKAITVSKVKRKQTWLKELLWEYFNQKDYKTTVKFEDEEERQDENRRKEEIENSEE